MIRLFLLALVSLLLVACSDVAREEKEGETIEEAVVEKKTEEQYIEEFKSVMSYDALVAETENSSLTPVDVDGDAIPEMVLIVNEDTFNAYVAMFKTENDEWIEIGRKAYTSNIYVQLSFVDKLQYQDSSKTAFVISDEIAGAGDLFKSLNVFMYDEAGQEIKRTVHFHIDPNYDAVDVVKDNQLNFKDLEGNEISYAFQDGQFVDNTGQRLGTIIDEELAQLLGTTINNHYLTLYDTYEEAVEKISETPELKEDSAGIMCANYPSFYFCEYSVEEGIAIYNMKPLHEVTAEQLEGYFGQPVIIYEWGDVENDGYYFAEVSTSDSMYGLRFDSDSPQAKLELLSFAPIYE